MAVYNEILAGRYNRTLQKLFGMKGEPPARQLAGEIAATMSFFYGAEMRYIESWDRYAFAFSLGAGGAGNFNQYQLRNPSGSNVVAVFEKIQFGAPGAAADGFIFSHGATAADLASLASTANARWDSRGRPQATLIPSDTAAVAADLTSTALSGNLAANTSQDIIITDIQEIPLLPGDAIRIRSTAANQANQAGFWWRERALEEGERF